MANKMTISLCMIVKNEEKDLRRCLSSIYLNVDEIIIVDTGSTDNTIEIAEAYADKLIHYEWNDNFAEARNIGVKEATKDFILWLDADDVVHDSSKLKQMELLEDFFYCLKLTNMKNDKKFDTCYQPRIFPNHKGIEFQRRAHESFVDDCIEQDIKPVYFEDSTEIIHYGYNNSEDLKAKGLRNVKLLQYDMDKYSNRPDYWLMCGNSYSMAEDYEKALECYVNAHTVPMALDPIYTEFKHHSIFVSIKLLRLLDRENEAFEKAIEAIKDYPYILTQYELGTMYMNKQGYPEDVNIYVKMAKALFLAVLNNNSENVAIPICIDEIKASAIRGLKAIGGTE